jgi:hypothetical protein
MFCFQCLFQTQLIRKKYFWNSLIAAMFLTLAGCSGDSMDYVELNPDNSVKFSKNIQEMMPTKEPIYLVDLKWSAPTTRANGVPIKASEIMFYRVQQHSSDGNITQVTDVPGNSTRIGMPVFAKGTYKFSVITIDMSGRQSEPTALIAATVQ